MVPTQAVTVCSGGGFFRGVLKGLHTKAVLPDRLVPDNKSKQVQDKQLEKIGVVTRRECSHGGLGDEAALDTIRPVRWGA